MFKGALHFTTVALSATIFSARFWLRPFRQHAMREGTTRFSAVLFVIVLLFASVAEAGQRGGAPLVNSFNGRTGDVVSITGDYSFPQITGTAVKSQLPSVTAFTDQANSFTANQGIAGNLSLTGTINLPRTSSSSAGVINFGGIRFIHNSGTNTGSCVVGNTFVGEGAGNFFTSTDCVNGNTGIGYAALNSITSGNGNTGVGYLALGRTTTGFLNTAFGLQTLFSNQTGSSNIALGFESLLLNTDGYNNIAIGVSTGNASGSEHNHDNIYIGHNIGDVENNTIRIGSSAQTSTFIAGISGVTTGLAGVPVLVDANGQLGTCCISSRRYKYDIRDMNDATNRLLKLRPVTFHYKQAQSDGSRPLQYGLIAEEVADVFPELVQYDPKTNEPNAVLYHVLPAMLLNEFQKQHERVEAQEQQIQSLQGQLEELVAQTRQLKSELIALKESERDKKLALVTPNQ